MEELKRRIEELRQELNILAYDMNSCDREILLQLSQELDKAICEYIKKEKFLYNINEKW